MPFTMLFHDRDTKFTATLDADLARRGIEVRKTAFRAPNANAFVERFIQTIQQECLDHFVIFGERMLVLPKGAKAKRRNRDKPPSPAIECRERLGGLVKHYYRRAS